MLAARRRLIPATVVVSAALAAGLLGPTSAHAAQATTETTATTTTSTSTATADTGTTGVTTADITPTTDTTSTGAVLALASTTVATATTATSTLSSSVATTAPVLTAAQIRARKIAAMRVKAVQVARNQVGDSYVAARSGPNAFDCSGLTLYVTKKAFGKSLPHYSKAQYAATKRVKKANLRPGDLVFFFRGGAHHVGVYIGHGKMVHAANPRADVRIDYVFRGWYGARYSGAGRVV